MSLVVSLLISQISRKTYEIVLSDVILIPEFRLSLISVNQLTSTKFSVNFPAISDMCYIQKDRDTILIAKHKDGLYYARVTLSDQKEAVYATIDINLLHCQMGHISVSQIQTMVNSGLLWGIDTLSRTPASCEACTLGKMKKLPFRIQEQPQTTQPLEMVHTYVGDPISLRSCKGHRFWLVIVDDFSCFPWIYFMKHKSEALKIYKQWKTDIQTHLRTEIGQEDFSESYTRFI